MHNKFKAIVPTLKKKKKKASDKAVRLSFPFMLLATQ